VSEQRSFADLGVIPPIVEALAQSGITEPFPIQSLAIPIAIAGTDLIGQARTGTGKTLAFGVSLLQRITVPADADHTEGPPQALVMCPTRELALQVTKDLIEASAVRKARILTVYGGVGYEPQLDMLADGVDVVVGTPGRLLDLVQRRSLVLSNVKVLVLDEADEMLDLGFLPDVESLIARTPKSRQTMLFSATMPAAIVSLARTHLNQAVNVRAETRDSHLTVPDTAQYVYQAHDLDKPALVGKILQAEGRGRTIIFTRTKRSAQRLSDELRDGGFQATTIHGDLSQVVREKALQRFRDGRADVLVATDVAARGIDIDDVTHVINYECPDNELTYVHRIGRTGRAGAKGVAVTLVDWADVTRWKLINKALDLNLPEPLETYSNSENLRADLGIPEGVKSWLREPTPRDPKPREQKSRDARPREQTQQSQPRADRSGERKKRPRRRLRNHEEVAGEQSA
jgi:superfamily II DNA/RNA helicase